MRPLTPEQLDAMRQHRATYAKHHPKPARTLDARWRQQCHAYGAELKPSQPMKGDA